MPRSTKPIPSKTPTPFATLIALAIALTDCNRARETIAPRSDRAVEADERSTARADAVALIDVRAATFAPITPHARVIVTPSGIDFDNAAVIRNWPAAERERAIQSLDGALPEAYPIERIGVVTVREGIAAPEQTRGGNAGFILTPLSETLEDAMRLERRHAELTREQVDTNATLYVHRDAPSRLVYQVMYTLAQAGFSGMDLVMRGKTAVGVLHYQIPRDGGPVRERPVAARSLAVEERARLAAEQAIAALAALDSTMAPHTAAPATAAGANSARSRRTQRVTDAGAASVDAGATATAPAPRTESILPVVHVTPTGYAIGWDEAFLQPGCATEGPRTVAVPLAGTALDPNGLRHCLAIAVAVPAWQARLPTPRNVLISATDVLFADLVRAIFATRETRPDAGDLFPEFNIAVGP